MFVYQLEYVSILYICSSVASFYIFNKFLSVYKNQPFLFRLKATDLACLCYLVLILSGGLSNVYLNYVNLYHLVGVFAILIASRLTKTGDCMVFSIMYGLGATLTSGSLEYLALFVLVGMSACFLQSKTSIYSCLGIIIVESLLGLYFNCLPFFTYVTLIETGIASIVQLCIPNKYTKMLRLMFVDDNNDYSVRDLANRNRVIAKAKLMDLSNVFFELDVVFKKMLKGELPIEEAKVLLVDEVKTKLCFKCKDKAKCSRIYGVQKEIETLMNIAFEKGKISLLDISSNMANNCLKTSQIIVLINRLINQYKQYTTMMKNLDNSRLLLADQLYGVAKIMQNLSFDFDNKIEGSISLENQILHFLEQIDICCAEIVVYGTKGNISSIAMLVKSADIDKTNFDYIISDCVGQKMGVVQSAPSETTGWTSIILEPKPTYTLMCGYYGESKTGNEISGDCYSILPLNNQKFMLAISDGMGHGERAKKNSELTISVIENFYKAGFDNDIVLSSVNKLVSINQLEDFASLDLCIIDLQNALIDMIKLGASQSYIKHAKTTTVIEGKALPLGVVEQVQAYVQKSALDEGDIIILCSDGVSECFGGLEKLYMYINHLEETSPQELADCIGAKAKALSKGVIGDDITIIVGRLVKTK